MGSRPKAPGTRYALGSVLNQTNEPVIVYTDKLLVKRRP